MSDPKTLKEKGYRYTSNKHLLVSRIDRSDWKEHMAALHAPWDPDGEGMDWVNGLGDGLAADFYRRVHSKDTLTTPIKFRDIPNSNHDPVGFVRLYPEPEIDEEGIKNFWKNCAPRRFKDEFGLYIEWPFAGPDFIRIARIGETPHSIEDSKPKNELAPEPFTFTRSEVWKNGRFHSYQIFGECEGVKVQVAGEVVK